MTTTRHILAAATVLLLGTAPAHAQNFLLNSAETINEGNFKLGVYPTGLFAEGDGDDQWGVAGRFGYGFTGSFDVEAKLAFFDGFELYGADAELWLVKGRTDASISAGFHLADFEGGVDSTAIDVAGLLSRNVGDDLEVYGGLSLSFESLDDLDEDFTRVYVVPGIEYRLSRDLDLVAELGLGLNDDSPNYVSFGLAYYLR